VTPAELAARVQALGLVEFDRQADDLAVSAATLELLGLIPKGTDYRRSIEDLYSGSVLGYYDDTAKELFVGAAAGPLSVFTRSTLVHELTHALTDQHFDFGPRSKALAEAELSEESVAFLSLIEGDAETVRILWESHHFNASEKSLAKAGEPGVNTAIYQRTPPYLVASLLFPYQYGTEFVDALRRSGGFGAVDAAYRQPPISTAQILHPERYLRGEEPAAPAAPAVPPEGCQLLDQGALGEFDMRTILHQQISLAVALDAAEGWKGDRFSFVRCGLSPALVDRWTASSDADAAALAAALGRWALGWSGSRQSIGAEGFFSGPNGAGRLTYVGSEVQLVLANSAPTVA
ncbi:MAG: hypothetical protein ACRDRT_17820, partial [Pseudonocardiaceae bacterium]